MVSFYKQTTFSLLVSQEQEQEQEQELHPASVHPVSAREQELVQEQEQEQELVLPPSYSRLQR
ncbi:MAG: hypothetical protein HQL09_09360 [Nitrospirae bacterium]|nr:hypothetical protein [Nitrospirota bacterium]